MIKHIALTFLISCFFCQSYSQDLYVNFEGQGFDTVHIRDMNPEAINKSFFRWNYLSAAFYGGDGKENGSGPFCLDFDYYRFINSTKHLLFCYANWQLIDAAYLESNYDPRVKRTNIGVEYAFGISSKLKEKTRQMTFYHIVPETHYIYYVIIKLIPLKA